MRGGRWQSAGVWRTPAGAVASILLVVVLVIVIEKPGRADYEDEGDDDDEAQLFLRPGLRSGGSAVALKTSVTHYKQGGTGSSDRFCPPIQVKWSVSVLTFVAFQCRTTPKDALPTERRKANRQRLNSDRKST